MNKKYIAPDMELLQLTMMDVLTVSRSEGEIPIYNDVPELPPENPGDELDL